MTDWTSPSGLAGALHAEQAFKTACDQERNLPSSHWMVDFGAKRCGLHIDGRFGPGKLNEL